MDIISHFTNYYYKKINGYLNKPFFNSTLLLLGAK